MYEIDYRAISYFSGLFVGSLLVLIIVFLPLEKLLPLKREQKILRSGWFTDILHFGVNSFLVQAGVGAVILAASYWLSKLLSALASVGLPHLGKGINAVQTFLGGQHTLVQFFLAVFVGDLIFYSYHRLAHSNRYLWRLHSVHHSTKEMDWLAAYRFHPLEQLIIQSVSVTFISLLGLDSGQSFLLGTLSRLADPLAHANTRLRFGPLRWLIMNPEFHHWHHSTEKQAYDKNFAGRFPFIDLIFGTGYFGSTPTTSFGIEDPVPSSYLKQFFYPFQRRTG